MPAMPGSNAVLAAQPLGHTAQINCGHSSENAGTESRHRDHFVQPVIEFSNRFEAYQVRELDYEATR